jgi:hypothetical protein
VIEYLLKDSKEAKIMFFDLETCSFLLDYAVMNVLASNILLPEAFYIEPNFLANNVQSLITDLQTKNKTILEYHWIEQVQ